MAAAAAGSLAGQRVAIFGGSSGRGRGAAAAVLRSGASVVLIGRDEAKLAATKVWLGGDSRVSTLLVDASDEGSVLDYVPTGAASSEPRSLHRRPVCGWRCARALAPASRSGRWCRGCQRRAH